ncbi:MAG: LCP family protein [Clostridia bacterium]|nr:LCP family protein [Clostridia bacterium]
MTKLAKRITLLLLGICLISSTVLGVLAAKKISEMPFGEQVNIGELDKENDQVGMINFLLIGIDADGTRSDTNMLLSYDGYSDRVNILSFPRDTKVLMNGHSQKLNAAMGVGLAKAKADMDDAPEEELIRQVKSLSGLPVHYFVTVDFDGFKEIIDVLGGVEFNIPYNMNYDDPVQNLHIHLKKGQQHLDGQMAHDFVRFRQNNGGSAPGEYVMGDEGRIYWQQRFLKALIAQKARPEYFDKLTDIFDVIVKHVRTNYTMQDLLKHVDVIQNLNVNDIESYQLPGDAVYENGVAWYVQDEAATDQLIHDVFLPRSREQWEKEQAEKAAAEQAALASAQAGTTMQEE